MQIHLHHLCLLAVLIGLNPVRADIYIDFGLPDRTTPGNWNNVTTGTAAVYSGLVDSAGTVTEVSLSIGDEPGVAGFQYTPQLAENGVLTGPAVAVDPFPATATADALWGNSGYDVTTAQPGDEPDGGNLVFSGLNPGTTYTFTAFGSSPPSMGSNTRYTVTGATTGNAFIGVTGNALTVYVEAGIAPRIAVVGSIQPTPEGIITLNVNQKFALDRTNQNGTFFLSALAIADDNAAPTWGPFPVAENGLVDTGRWLGWVDIAAAPWVWVLATSQWVYLPEDQIAPEGGWMFIP